MNFESHIPLHIQLKDLLKTEIFDGKHVEKIPSERELMERFTISRSTVREAVSHLVNEGVLKKIHGKGTYITKNKTVHDWLNTLNSFTDTVRNMGMKPGAKLLHAKMIDNFPELKDLLKHSTLFSIARLRTADDQPIAIERHYYNPHLGQQISAYDLNTATIYDVLEKNLNIAIIEAEQTVRCHPISLEDAKLLNLQPNINVLCVERILLGAQGEVIEYYSSLFHPELYMLKLKTKRAVQGVG
ncbi:MULTISPECIES: GntR family transcriptional regulator [Solibacillus]|uniref:GntR family transcriptional regulator n=1 Tax=Solibacillus merdavium TaxID=2762218 RepID=A0ABR8XRR2_9BACL|nr:GntR family transcriptional regulator [Solibacillus merdavium]MBD8034628.1 GntR family transcriptional regulator [Solibacillus merdavium]